jgi:hypothetical protein
MIRTIFFAVIVVPVIWVVYLLARRVLPSLAAIFSIALSETDQIAMAFLACFVLLIAALIVVWEDT